MAESIMQNDKASYLSGRTDWLEKHHIFGGANRKLSEKYGLWVWLTHDEHNEPPHGVHHNIQAMRELQKQGQLAFMAAYPDKDFQAIFGRNYL